MDVELAVDWPPRDFNLELLSAMGLVNRTTAVGAIISKRGFMDLVDLLGWWAVRVGTVLGTGFTAGFLRFFLRRSLGERSGLAFAGTPLLVEQAGQALDLNFEISDAALQASDDLVTLLASWAGGGFHAKSITEPSGRSCASFKTNQRVQLPRAKQ